MTDTISTIIVALPLLLIGALTIAMWFFDDTDTADFDNLTSSLKE